MDHETPTSITPTSIVTTSITPGPKRINSKFVKHLHKQFKNALREVKKLKASILNIDTVTSKGYKVVTRRGVKVHVNLSNPELVELRDKRNILTLELTKAVREEKQCKSKYLDAVRINSAVSRKSLTKYRVVVSEKKTQKMTAEIKEHFMEAAFAGYLKVITNLKQLALTESNPKAFKKELVVALKQSGRPDLRYVPLPSGIQVMDYLKNWELPAEN